MNYHWLCSKTILLGKKSCLYGETSTKWLEKEKYETTWKTEDKKQGIPKEIIVMSTEVSSSHIARPWNIKLIHIWRNISLLITFKCWMLLSICGKEENKVVM